MFFLLGVNLYFTGQPGSGDCSKGAGAAAAASTTLRRSSDNETELRSSGFRR
ncbi:hypothetical protein QQM39_00340 [Streptomyces sp. DT2A-34]|uniref:hypothetical protein n=1 Tax=Streptomyces sp. DT2A-34 TaxID=3051182 RepID=UPI00265C1D57|nr:hypothetical protein [Streptomyces sp. DT2A-34]MDO0909367.1 hypothetical protein [Streptomyces sp. DT2A-34]